MKRVLLSAPFLGFVALVILALAVWFAGELFDATEGVWTRVAIIVGLALVWALLSGLWWLRRRRKARALTEGLVEDPDADAITDEEAALRRKFADAMRDLAKLRFRSRFGGRRHVYELPWYVIIGPPGAGKTTALANSGLEFPLRKGDEIALDGVGGTRNCDWVFTNEAVFIDTAGRYATQRSNEAVDRAAWTNFLSLLEKTRPGEPINGVILAISLAEIATADAAGIDALAKVLRERLAEIDQTMSAAIPVYVMFTKTDLLAGFTEFFQSMRPEERKQVWGATFPLGALDDLNAQAQESLALVEPEFDDLVARLGEIQFSRMQEEQDPALRGRIFAFPAQFSSMKPVVARLLRKTFEPDRFSRPFILRGFYFTSATQTGQPVDRLIARMAANFGLERQAVGLLSGSGRSYFLSDLLDKVVFPEQGIVQDTARRRRGMAALKIAGLAACVALPILAGFGFWSVWQHNSAQADRFVAAMDSYEGALIEGGLATVDAETGDVRALPVADQNLEAALAPLAVLRDARDALRDPALAPPFGGLGLDDSESIEAQAKQAYAEALDDLMRTRMLFRLEQQLDEHLHQPEAVYDYLKAYMMLGGVAPTLDRAWLKDFFREDWARLWPGLQYAALKTELAGHLDALLEAGLKPRDLNNDWLAKARAAVGQISLSERAYRIMRRSPEARALSNWDPVTSGGRAATVVFVRKSGEPLETPVPGFFTYDGFWSYFVGAIDDAARAAMNEQWIVESAEKPGAGALPRMIGEILELYYADYIDVWNKEIDDLRFVTFRDVDHAADVFSAASSTTSPWVRILLDMARQTDLATIPGAGSALTEEIADEALHAARDKARQATTLGLAAISTVAEDRPGKPVSDAFEELRDFVRDGRPGSEVDNVRRSLNALYGRVLDMKRRGERLEILSATPEGAALIQAAKRAPRSIEQSIVDLFEQADAFSRGRKKAQLNEVWSSRIFPICQQSIHGRYPFGRGDPAPLLDLEQVLGPNGVLDAFFRDELARFVNASVTPWQWTPEGRMLGIPEKRLAFFEKAAKVRRAFFPRGAPSPQMRLNVIPKAFDPEVSVARFQVGGAQASFENGKRQGQQLIWPGAQPGNGASLALQYATGEGEAYIGEPGEWGLFRLLDASGVRPLGSGDRVRVRFMVEGRPFVAEISLGASENPLSLRGEIRGFRCPSGL